MNSEGVIIIADEPTLVAALTQSLASLGYQSLPVTTSSALSRTLGLAPVLVILDLTSQGFDWQHLLGFIKGQGKKANHLPVIGLGSPDAKILAEQAITAGCAVVVSAETGLEQLPHLIQTHKWIVDQNRCLDSPPPLLLEGIHLLNQGAFFECHEVIEDAWNEEPAPIRVMYQGILQVGVACYHIQKRNWRGAVKVFARALPKIKRFAPTCMGIDLARLVSQTEALQAELQRLGPEWEGEFNASLFPTVDVLPR